MLDTRIKKLNLFLLCGSVPLRLILLFLALPLALQAQTRVSRMNYTGRTLANGLKVYSLRDNTNPAVSIQVWYHVGSKDDPAGRSGFAHLFEHMMFKSTQHMPSEFM